MSLGELRGDALASLFRSHVDAGGHPGEFPGVVNVSIKPPQDIDPEIVCRVSVKGSKESARRAPCNVCGRAEKFRTNGYLVRIGPDLYIIGKDCGRSFLGTSFITEEERLSQTEREERAAAWLEELGASAPGWVATIDALAPLAEASDRAQQVLRVNAGKDLWRWLGGSAHSHSGRLVIRDESGVLKPYARVEGLGYFEDGSPAVTKKLQKARDALAELLREGWKPEMIRRNIARLRRNKSLIANERQCRAAVKATEEAWEQIRRGQRLFARDNWSNIENWLSRADCPANGAARQDGTRRKLTNQRDGGGHFAEVGPLLAAKLPELPSKSPD